jgi:hypothetical protein
LIKINKCYWISKKKNSIVTEQIKFAAIDLANETIKHGVNASNPDTLRNNQESSSFFTAAMEWMIAREQLLGL